MTMEHTILANLMHNESYIRKVMPFLDARYFDDDGQKVCLEKIREFFLKYNERPTTQALMIEVSNTVSSQSIRQSVQDTLNELQFVNENEQWLMDETEKFCKQKSAYCGVLDAFDIIDGRDSTQSLDAIPSILTKALNVCFDTNIGHDYIQDAEARFDYYNLSETKVPFDLDILNKITCGGISLKTLNLIAAGCVHPSTKVKVRLRICHDWVEKVIEISEIEHLLNGGYEIEIDSPDGWVGVNMFVDKGEWDEYILETDNGYSVRVNENHLFETTDGWKYAKNLVGMCDTFLTDVGLYDGVVRKTGLKIPIVDIQVEHENHRYYANGVSSHNTGVGKSLMMCHIAARAIRDGKNVLYITLELSEEKIAQRIDANLMNVSVNDIPNLDKDVYMSKIDKISSKTDGVLKIKEYPTSGAHCGHFKSLLEEYKSKQKFVPDLIIVDYLAICASSRLKNTGNVNSYTYVKAIAEELRGLAVEYNVPVLSAIQTTRSANVSTEIDIADVAESFGISHTADLIIAMIRTEELDKLNQVMIQQLKNRYNDTGYYNKFVLGLDRGKMKFYNVEESAQTDVTNHKTTQAPSSNDFGGFKF